MYEKSKFKVSAYQNEIDIREEEINRLRRNFGQLEEDYSMLKFREEQMQQR